MILYRTADGAVVEHGGRHYPLSGEWDELVNDVDLGGRMKRAVRGGAALRRSPRVSELLAPIGSQEVWAAGVTYQRSRTARMSESKQAGGSDFYDRVYHAERPELFMKATAQRVVGPGAAMHLRRDSRWMVPEPELTLAVDRRGRIVGYTIGNDLSCRDLEGENPLYLPQAKTFAACAAVGPGILVTGRPLPRTTEISIVIQRRGQPVFRGATRISEMRKSLRSLVEYLYRDNTFPDGCLLMTGTGVVPPGRFSLRRGDVVRITIEPIGTLVNVMS